VVSILTMILFFNILKCQEIVQWLFVSARLAFQLRHPL